MTRNDHGTLIREVRSKLLPLGPVAGVLDGLLQCLPRRFIPVEITPKRGIEIINQSKGEYVAVDNDPQFAMWFRSVEFQKGWYYLESALSRHSGDRTAKIYFDTGHGYAESQVILIPSNLRGSIREVFKLPPGVIGLRWDPMESDGRFSQSYLIIHRITTIEAYLRMSWRVVFDLRSQKMSFGQVLQDGKKLWTALTSVRESYVEGARARLHRASGGSYESFLALNDTITDQDRASILEHIEILPYRPLISIVTPVYNPPVDYFREALESVRRQLYPNWQMCLADDASTNPEIRAIIEEFKGLDSRFLAVYRPQNGHISAASNSALELATGDYVAFLDQDDVIPENALYHVAVEINRFPEAELIYSDEDKLDSSGNRIDPYFKTDWDPDLFCSHNLITHLAVYRASTIREIGGFRLGYEGSQDYDLAMRMVAHVPERNIRHIPRILYHWRMHEGSTADASSGSKLYAYEAAIKVLTEYLAGRDVRVDHGPHLGSYRTRYQVPEQKPLVSLMVPTKDKIEILSKCISSILEKTRYQPYEILVIDNRSEREETFKYFDKIRRDPRIKVLPYDAPFNFSAINNFAARHARGDILGLINNDVEVIEPEWLDEMVGHVLRPEVGVVGAKLLYPDGRIQHAGVVLGLGGLAAHSHRFFPGDSPGYCGLAYLTRSCSALTAACLLVRKSIYEEVGGMDEENLKVAYNDVDFCLKVGEAGYRNVYTPYAILYHHESVSRGAEDSDEKRARFASETRYMRERWGHILDADPYYNPNLTTSREDFSVSDQVVRSPHHGYPLTV